MLLKKKLQSKEYTSFSFNLPSWEKKKLQVFETIFFSNSRNENKPSALIENETQSKFVQRCIVKEIDSLNCRGSDRKFVETSGIYYEERVNFIVADEFKKSNQSENSFSSFLLETGTI